MKRYIALLLLVVTASLFAIPMSNNALFIRGNDLYAQKEFDKALENYSELIDRGIVNANLYFNAGNCHFREGHLGPAILNFKRALRINSAHKQAQNNLLFALSLTQDKQIEENPGFIASIWNKVFAVFTINFVALTTLFLFIAIIAVLLLIMLKFRHSEKSIPVFILTVLLFLFTLNLFITIARATVYNSKKPAVLLADSAVGHSGPGEDFSRVFTIHEGMSISIENEQKGWVLVKLPNGLGGWIPNNSIARVNP